MATRDELRAIVAALPETTIDLEAMHVSAHGKAIVWPWLERIDPKRGA